ncbi:MAG: DUF2232 domain-containing protein [Pseudorhodoplanes sp.]|nr:DUF2232 domain-containing protein [Pseudorhodoplanes sp.]
MMMQIALVGIGAGAASALLFASVASGSLFSIILFYLAPLPILIAAIGWSHWSAMIAALVAAAGLAIFLAPFFFIAFLIGIGLPAWWLGYLALLARPMPGAPGGIEWYPPGRLIVWAALLGGLVVIAAIGSFGFDEESFRSGLRTNFERILRIQAHIPADQPLEIPGTDIKRLIEFLVAVIPLDAGVIATFTSVLNLWLAARIVRTSGRLRRPWPDLPSMQFPPATTALFAVLLAVSFVSGIVGTMAGILAASLSMAFGLLGFAVLHALTRGRSGRGFILGGTYAAVLIFGWPILIMTLIGVTDAAFDLRGRFANAKPPAPPTV